MANERRQVIAQATARRLAAGLAFVETALVAFAWLVIARINAMPSERTSYQQPRGPQYLAGQALWAALCALIASCLVVAGIHLRRGRRSRGAAAVVWVAVGLNALIAATLAFMTRREPGIPILGVALTVAMPASCAAAMAVAWRIGPSVPARGDAIRSAPRTR